MRKIKILRDCTWNFGVRETRAFSKNESVYVEGNITEYDANNMIRSGYAIADDNEETLTVVNEKMHNPVIENKAADPVDDNKTEELKMYESKEDSPDVGSMTIEEIHAYAESKGIEIDKRKKNIVKLRAELRSKL